jgi:hypothetical protein
MLEAESRLDRAVDIAASGKSARQLAAACGSFDRVQVSKAQRGSFFELKQRTGEQAPTPARIKAEFSRRGAPQERSRSSENQACVQKESRLTSASCNR